eukprot:544627_1
MSDYLTDYSIVSSQYDKAHVQHEYFKKTLHYAINSYLINDSNLSVIDIGCGTGTLCQIMKNTINYKEILGVDYSTDQIKIAKQKQNQNITFKDIKYMVGDATTLYKDERFNQYKSKFDISLSIWTCNYAKNVFELDNMIKGASLMLKPGGLHICVSCSENAISSDEKFWKKYGYQVFAPKKDRITNKVKDGSMIEIHVDATGERLKDEGTNCMVFRSNVFTLKTYNKLFNKNGFVNIKHIIGTEFIPHPELNIEDKDKCKKTFGLQHRQMFIMTKKVNSKL